MEAKYKTSRVSITPLLILLKCSCMPKLEIRLEKPGAIVAIPSNPKKKKKDKNTETIKATI